MLKQMRKGTKKKNPNKEQSIEICVRIKGTSSLKAKDQCKKEKKCSAKIRARVLRKNQKNSNKRRKRNK